MDLFLLNLINALQLSMLIFILAVGLTLVFGLMDILNLAHGAFYTIGAFSGFMIARYTGSFWLALLLGPLLPAAIGYLLQALVLEPLRLKGRSVHLDLALLTFGMLFVTIGVTQYVWGSDYVTIALPEALNGGVRMFGVSYPLYRLFIIAVGLAVALVLWAALDRTVLGATVRAGVDNREMVEGLGVNIGAWFAGMFALGSGLAGLAGVIAAPVFSAYAQMGVNIFVITLIVVIVGGLGNFKGSFYGALIVGMVDTFTAAYLPGAGLFAIYALLAAVMLFRPQGLFGRRGQAA